MHYIVELSSYINNFILDSGFTQDMEMETLEKYMANNKEIELVKIGIAKRNQILYANKQGTLKRMYKRKDVVIRALLVT